MKHFKLSKDLTLGQKILVFVLIFNVSVILSLTNASAEEISAREYTTAEIIQVLGAVGRTSAPAGSCEATEERLNEQLRSIAKSCGSSGYGGSSCLTSTFQCNESNADSEACEGYRSAVALPSSESESYALDEQRDELEDLEKEKEKLEERKAEAQAALDELNGKLEDKLLEEGAAQEEFEHTVKSNDAQTQAKIEALTINMKALDEQNNGLFLKVAEQKKQMIQFMTEAKLQCNEKAAKDSTSFYNNLKICMSGRGGNCNLSLNSFIRNGNRSLAGMAQAYGRTKKRQCLSLDGQSDFAIKYRAMQALINNEQQVLASQQQQILKNRAELTMTINVAQAQGNLANTQAGLKKANKLSALAVEKIKLQANISLKQGELQTGLVAINKMQVDIESKRAAIASTRRSMSRAISSSDLGKARESQYLASLLASDAQSAVDSGCACTGALKNISSLSGMNFCGGSTSAPATETIELDDYADAEF